MQGGTVLTINNSAWFIHRFSQDVAFGRYVVFLNQILCFVFFIVMPEFVAPVNGLLFIYFFLLLFVKDSDKLTGNWSGHCLGFSGSFFRRLHIISLLWHLKDI